MQLSPIWTIRVAACLALLTLAGCVEETPTPSLVDPTGFVTYVHPTGVFTLSMPPTWVVSDTSSEYALNVDFSPPGWPDPVVSIYVVSLEAIGGAAPPGGDVQHLLDQAITDYQSVFYTSSTDSIYKELAREPQPDGSLRIKFVIDAPQGTSQHNDFVQIVEPYFAAMRVRLPDDQTIFRTATRVITSLTLNSEAEWRSTIETAGGDANRDVVGFASLNAWVDRNGGFVVVGQVVNNADRALEFVRITAQLFDAAGNLLGEQDDFVSSDLMLPGEFAPFSLIFADGLPPGTARYDLNASARYADFEARTFYGPENFEVSSEATFNENGFLVISGNVRNRGSQSSNLVKVIVTIFDQQQRVIATDTTLVTTQQLAPGETSSFSVIFVELGGVPHTFLVTAQGVIGE